MRALLFKLKFMTGLSSDAQSRSEVAREAFRAALGFSLGMTSLQASIWSFAYLMDLMPNHPTDMLLCVFILTPLLALCGAFIVYYRAGLRIHGLAVTNKALEEMSRVDPLSKLLNRRAFLDAFAKRTEDAMLIVFDIDFFKQVNDRHGHAAGDEVIETVAGVIRRVFNRATDVVCRLGGEEFGVLSQSSKPEDDYSRADRVRVETIRCEFSAGDQRFFVTLSGGMAHAGAGIEFETAFKHADKALYAAKQRGRNLILRPCHSDVRRA
jgi:diguanylate cyclase (GGDEF)-like protein